MYNIELSQTNTVFCEVIKEFTVMDEVCGGGDKYTDSTGMRNNVEINTYFIFTIHCDIAIKKKKIQRSKCHRGHTVAEIIRISKAQQSCGQHGI